MKQLLLNLSKTAGKMVIPLFDKDYRYYAFELQHVSLRYLVIYCYKKGSYWNISGTHFYYLHDYYTGEFINSYSAGITAPQNKERLLKADLIELTETYIKAKQAA